MPAVGGPLGLDDEEVADVPAEGEPEMDAFREPDERFGAVACPENAMVVVHRFHHQVSELRADAFECRCRLSQLQLGRLLLDWSAGIAAGPDRLCCPSLVRFIV